MDELKSQWIDREHFVRRLNRHITESPESRFKFDTLHPDDELEARLESAYGIYDVPQGVTPFLYRLRVGALVPKLKEENSLIQIIDECAVPEENNVGYVIYERGDMPIIDSDRRYELLILRTRETLLLRNSKEIPECKVVYFVQGRQVGESYKKISEKRHDYIYNGSLWVPTDISGILPTLWLQKMERKKQTQGIAKQYTLNPN